MLYRLLPLVTVLLLALSACANAPAEPRKPNAVGEAGLIYVVTDSLTWAGPVGDALRGTLGASVAPPLSVADFSLRRRELTDAGFGVLRASRQLVFAAPLDDSSAVVRFLEARLDDEGVRAVRAGEGAFVAPRRDVWANGQGVVFAAAATDSLLADAIRQNADTLTALFSGLTREQVRSDMFERGRQTNIEAAMLQNHGFAVNVQHDYFVSFDTTAAPAGLDGQYLRLRRVLSDTWRDLSIYYEDMDAPPADAYVEEVTDRMLQTFIRGQYDSSYVRLDRVRPIRTDSTVLAGYAAQETRGLWRMTEDFMGGPFVRYSFYDDAQDRLYVLFGMVYAPQHKFRGNKREYLRQLEIIAETFRTAPPA